MNDKILKKLAEAIENMSPSGIFQDRRRPYNGQPQTDCGERGMTEVKGLTMRDITDCVRIAIWESCGSPENAASIYDCDLSDCDAIAIEKNITCNIEKMMGIYPNVPTLNYNYPIINLDQEDGPEYIQE
jgi:hypothetical protein